VAPGAYFLVALRAGYLVGVALDAFAKVRFAGCSVTLQPGYVVAARFAALYCVDGYYAYQQAKQGGCYC
jgi:hypothetical protein